MVLETGCGSRWCRRGRFVQSGNVGGDPQNGLGAKNPEHAILFQLHAVEMRAIRPPVEYLVITRIFNYNECYAMNARY